MDKSQALQVYKNFKEMIINSKYELSSFCLDILEGNFVFSMTYRFINEEKNSKYKNILEKHEVAIDYRIFNVISYDINFEVLTDSNISKIFKIDVNYNKNDINSYKEFIDPNFDEILVLLFVTGKLYSKDKVFSDVVRVEMIDKRQSILGFWQNSNMYYDFKNNSDVLSFRKGDNYEFEGNYTIINNLLVIEYKTIYIREDVHNKSKEIFIFEIFLNSLILRSKTNGERIFLGLSDRNKYWSAIEDDFPQEFI